MLEWVAAVLSSKCQGQAEKGEASPHLSGTALLQGALGAMGASMSCSSLWLRHDHAMRCKDFAVATK